MDAVKKISSLLAKHDGSETTYAACGGCAICKEIDQLRYETEFFAKAEEKYESILVKGHNMTLEEVLFLNNKEIMEEDMIEAFETSLDDVLSVEDFYNILRYMGVTEDVVNEIKYRPKGGRVTKTVTFRRYKHIYDNYPGRPTLKVIAKELGVGSNSLSAKKRKWKEKGLL